MKDLFGVDCSASACRVDPIRVFDPERFSLFRSNAEEIEAMLRKSVGRELSGEEEMEFAVIDFLADLLHFCEQREIEFDRVLSSACFHCDDEVSCALEISAPFRGRRRVF